MARTIKTDGRPAGYALLVVLAFLTLLALLAAEFAVRAQLSLSASACDLRRVQNELLARSSREEARVLLAYAPFYDCENHGRYLFRDVRDSTGKTVGRYSLRLTDESVRPTLLAGDGQSDVAENAPPATSSRFSRQPVYYALHESVRTPANVNLPDAHLENTLLTLCHHSGTVQGRALFARITDFIDDNHSLSDNEHGREAVMLARLYLNNSHQIFPLGITHCAEVAGAAKRAGMRVMRVGRLARGWAENRSDWGKSCYRYLSTAKSDIGRSSARLVFKPYASRPGQCSVGGETVALADALEAAAPGAMNEFGVDGMWQGTLIKARAWTHSDVGPNTPDFYDEWMVVKDNHLKNGEMVFECTPFFSETFHTNFVDTARDGLYTFGWHSWYEPGDALLDNLPNALHGHGAECSVIASDYTIKDELERHTHGEALYVNDALVVEGLDMSRTYRFSILADPWLDTAPRIEVLTEERYCPVTFVHGRAELFGGRAVAPQPARMGGHEAGYMVIPFRISRADARRANGLYALEIRSEDQWSELVSLADRPIDLRGWSLGFMHVNGATQTLARITHRPEDGVPMIKPGARRRLVSADGNVRDDATSVLQLDYDWYGPLYRVHNAETRADTSRGGAVHLTTFTLDEACLRADACIGRLVRLHEAVAADTEKGKFSAPFRVAANSETSVTIEHPPLPAGVARRIAPGIMLEFLGLSPGNRGSLTLCNSFAGRAAAVTTDGLPTNACINDTVSYRFANGAWEQTPRDASPVSPAPGLSFNRPVTSPADFCVWLAGNPVGEYGRERLWEWMSSVDFATVPVDARTVRLNCASPANAGYANLAPRAVTDHTAAWLHDMWQGYYVQLDAATDTLYRIAGNTRDTLLIDAAGFPTEKIFSPAPGTHAYRILTDTGEPVIPLSGENWTYVYLACAHQPEAPVRLVFNTHVNTPVDALFEMAGTIRQQFLTLSTNRLAGGITATPFIASGLAGTHAVVRVKLLNTPAGIAMLTGARYVPEPAREGAVNVNSATPQELTARLGWSRPLALRVWRHRPYHTFADLLRVRGVTEKMLLDAYPKILFHSVYWRADIHAGNEPAHSHARAWFACRPEDKCITCEQYQRISRRCAADALKQITDKYR